MPESIETLSQRIIQAARLAVAMHMYAAPEISQPKQQVKIGGAGPRFFTTGGIPCASRERRVSPTAGEAK